MDTKLQSSRNYQRSPENSAIANINPFTRVRRLLHQLEREIEPLLDHSFFTDKQKSIAADLYDQVRYSLKISE